MAFPALIPVIAASVGAALLKLVPAIVFKVLSALGLGYLLFSGLSVITDNLLSILFASYNNLPIALLQLLDLAGVHKALNMVASTIGVIVIWKAAEKSSALRRKQFLT